MGKKLEYIVKGAIAQCNQSKVPMIAQLQTIVDNLFIKVNGNPVATSMTLGPVFGPAPFGICNMIPPTPAVPTPPCVCVITSWTSAYSGDVMNLVSNPLTTDSKGMCALGGSISFKMSGQFPKPTIPPLAVPSMESINPLSGEMMKKLKNKAKKGNTLYAHFDGDMGDVYLLCEQLNAADIEYRMVETDSGIALAILGTKGGTLGTMTAISADEESNLPSCGQWEDPNKPGDSVFHPNEKNKPRRFPKPTKKGVDDIPRKPFGHSGDKYDESIIGEVEHLVNKHLVSNGDEPNYKFQGVPFKDGEADFDECCIGQVKVDFYSLDRPTNFRRANELMAEDLNKRHPKGIYDKETKEWRKYTAKDVDDWMKDPEHRMTWHERQDRKTMQKIPSILHGNLNHSGGISMEGNEINEVFGLTDETQDYNQMIAMSRENQALLESGKSVDEVKLNMEKQGADLAQKRALEKQKKEAEAGKYTTTDSELFV